MQTFNVIFVPGCVRELRLFVFSLLEHCPRVRFRLVSNNCRPDEQRMLQRLCSNHARLEFLALPVTETASHATAVRHLHERERGDVFAFMDSDIGVTGDFTARLLPLLAENQAVFSGASSWVLPEENIAPREWPHLDGRHAFAHTGLCCGVTYIACYDNRALKQFLNRVGPDAGGRLWEKAHWAQLPSDMQALFAQHDLRKDFYDSCKCLNLALQLQGGGRVRYEPTPEVLHVGGLSLHSLGWRPPEPSLPVHRERARVIDYVSAVFASLFDHQPFPTLPEFQTPHVRDQVAALATQLQTLHARHAAELDDAAPAPSLARRLQVRGARWLQQR